MNERPLLAIQDLRVCADDKPILQGLNLTVGRREVHVLMGRNGQGKTTVAQVVAGAPDYKVVGGAIYYDGEDLVAYTPEERAAKGLFVAFQHPVAIPGVSLITFLKASMDALARARGEALMSTPDLLALVKKRMQALDLAPAFLSRPLNEGFSGGEKKRVELLQMTLLAPQCAILDEPDSGLDADALARLGKELQRMREEGGSLLIITHYTHLFNYLTPDVVHVLDQGRIVKQGKAALAQQLLQEGYNSLLGLKPDRS
ncbi:MAG: Fe-S cluster assembly ATPase SufC [Bacteroidota bacterium]